MRLAPAKERIRTRQVKDQFERYIESFYIAYHHYPTMRQIQKGLDIPSLSTVSRYVHKLIDEGKIKPPEETLPKKRETESLRMLDNSLHRKCIRTNDGSILYLDCQVIQTDNGRLDVQVSGIVDLSRCKRNIAQVVSCANVEG